MFKKLKFSTAAARLLEEQLYERVANELASGQQRDGLWAKALANAKGSEQGAKGLYIRYRVQSIKDELEVSNTLEASFKANVEAKEQTRLVVKARTKESECQAILKSKGYKLKNKGSGWVIIEPQGGRAFIDSIEELEQYAISRRAN